MSHSPSPTPPPDTERSALSILADVAAAAAYAPLPNQAPRQFTAINDLLNDEAPEASANETYPVVASHATHGSSTAAVPQLTALVHDSMDLEEAASGDEAASGGEDEYMAGAENNESGVEDEEGRGGEQNGNELAHGEATTMDVKDEETDSTGDDEDVDTSQAPPAPPRATFPPGNVHNLIDIAVRLPCTHPTCRCRIDKAADLAKPIDQRAFQFYCEWPGPGGCAHQSLTKSVFARRCISNFFGRNKKVTGSVPNPIIWCRHHYQKNQSSYEYWHSYKLVLLREQIQRIRAHDEARMAMDPSAKESKFIICLQESECYRLLDLFSGQEVRSRPARDHKRGETYEAPVDILLYLYQHYMGEGKHRRHCLACISWIEAQMRAGNLPQPPMIEFLPVSDEGGPGRVQKQLLKARKQRMYKFTSLEELLRKNPPTTQASAPQPPSSLRQQTAAATQTPAFQTPAPADTQTSRLTGRRAADARSGAPSFTQPGASPIHTPAPASRPLGTTAHIKRVGRAPRQNKRLSRISKASNTTHRNMVSPPDETETFGRAAATVRRAMRELEEIDSPYANCIWDSLDLQARLLEAPGRAGGENVIQALQFAQPPVTEHRLPPLATALSAGNFGSGVTSEQQRAISPDAQVPSRPSSDDQITKKRKRGEDSRPSSGDHTTKRQKRSEDSGSSSDDHITKKRKRAEDSRPSSGDHITKKQKRRED